MIVGPLLSGGLIGLTIAVPVGPMAMLCVSRTLGCGRAAGIATGLGSATVHAVYGTAAILTSEVLTIFLHVHAGAMRGIGGFLLVCFGLSMLIRSMNPSGITKIGGSMAGHYLSAVAVAVSNPMTLTGFLTAMAAFSATGMDSAPLVAGIVLASASWYILLCFTVAAVGHHLTPAVICGFNRLVALAIFAMGITVSVWALS